MPKLFIYEFPATLIYKKIHRVAGNEETCYLFFLVINRLHEHKHLETSSICPNFLRWPPRPSWRLFSPGKYFHDDTAACCWCPGKNYVKENLAATSEPSSVLLFPSVGAKFEAVSGASSSRSPRFNPHSFARPTFAPQCDGNGKRKCLNPPSLPQKSKKRRKTHLPFRCVQELLVFSQNGHI